MAEHITVIVKQKFQAYNVGERIGADEKQIRQWEKFDLVERVPQAPAVEQRAMETPPQHKMVTVADEAKTSDEPEDAPQRRGPGRPPSR